MNSDSKHFRRKNSETSIVLFVRLMIRVFAPSLKWGLDRKKKRQVVSHSRTTRFAFSF